MKMNRRELLKTSLLAGAAATFGGSRIARGAALPVTASVGVRKNIMSLSASSPELAILSKAVAAMQAYAWVQGADAGRRHAGGKQQRGDQQRARRNGSQSHTEPSFTSWGQALRRTVRRHIALAARKNPSAKADELPRSRHVPMTGGRKAVSGSVIAAGAVNSTTPDRR